MRLQTLLVLGAVVDTTLAGCYTSGEWWKHWTNQRDAQNAARDLCYNWLADWFDQGQTKTRCAPLDMGIHVDFTVGWRGQGRYWLNPQDCYDRLSNEIWACELGGASTIADWYFV